jgi:exonuclease III
VNDDGLQGMLFAGVHDGIDEAPAEIGEIRLCALNVNSPSPQRAQKLLEWLLASRCNAVVLTEMQPTQGGRLLLTGLDATGYEVTCSSGWQSARYLAVVATRGFNVSNVQRSRVDPRVVAVDATAGSSTIRLVGVYAPTNGMTADSSKHRSSFQQWLLNHITEINHPALCVSGDLNVVEPDHQPHLPAFEPHDYAFYCGLIERGLRDAYRTLNPQGTDHSWINDQYGRQRLDHTFVAGQANIHSCGYDHTPRQEGFTDHAAMMTTLRLTGTSDRR